MAFVRWFVNAAVTVAVTFLLLRALVEFMPGLNAVPLFGALVRSGDPTLEKLFRTVGIPWTQDLRGLVIPAMGITLIVLRAVLRDALDPERRKRRPKPQPAAPAAKAAAAAPAPASVPAPAPAAPQDPNATLLTNPAAHQPIQSVTGTAFLAQAQPPISLLPQGIGRYEIVEELGQGAMGRVYKANDPKIGRAVAIKTLSAVGIGPEMEQYRARFLLEAKSAGRLNHPGIVSVYDVVDDHYGRPCLVLEFVNGTTLDRLVRDEPLPLATVLDYVAQVARALEYAHAQGIVHRDVKPANIMITSAGQAKLSDFGIAKIEGTTLTMAGQVLGTPAFMSPEQCKGEPVDYRTDIFSLGTVLYSLIAGLKPFPGDTFTSVAYKVVHTDYVPLSEIDPKLPKALDAVVARCLAKEPDARYPAAGHIAMDLDPIRVNLPPPEAPPAATT